MGSCVKMDSPVLRASCTVHWQGVLGSMEVSRPCLKASKRSATAWVADDHQQVQLRARTWVCWTAGCCCTVYSITKVNVC